MAAPTNLTTVMIAERDALGPRAWIRKQACMSREKHTIPTAMAA